MIFLEQGSVLPSTNDDKSNDSVTIVDQITIKEGSLIKKHKLTIIVNIIDLNLSNTGLAFWILYKGIKACTNNQCFCLFGKQFY